jgi:tyrosine-protein kinase Etk/Wzc
LIELLYAAERMQELLEHPENKEFGLRREVGVSEYVAGTVSLEDIVKPTAIPNLWVVTTGQIPPNPSELLMHLRFEQLLEQLGKQFDTLIVDAPPILAVSDAAIIGRQVGATLMVARAGHHPIQELEQAVKRLNHAGVTGEGICVQRFEHRSAAISGMGTKDMSTVIPIKVIPDLMQCIY